LLFTYEKFFYKMENLKSLSSQTQENETDRTELLRRNQKLAALNEVIWVASRQKNLEDMLTTALQSALDLVEREAGWIVLLDANGMDTHLACYIGLPEDVARREAEEGFMDCECSQVVDDRRPMMVAELRTTCPLYQLRLQNGGIVNGHMAIPLVSKSQVLGTLNIACTRVDCVSEDDLRFMGVVGRQLGLAVENGRLWAEVREKEAVQSRLLEKLMTAQEEERKRIARELHDDTSQALTSLMVGLKVLSGLNSRNEIEQHTADLRKIVAETLEAVHDLALELRPSVLDDLGLAAALERYVAEYQRRFDVRVDFRAVGFEEQRLLPAIETAIYRIVQEALTNVARHAQAEHASVLLERRKDRVRAIIEDNGNGFDLLQDRTERNLGLYGMEERATLIGGRLRIESQYGVGTTLALDVPLDQSM
jgi:signal transduction histidine kinase